MDSNATVQNPPTSFTYGSSSSGWRGTAIEALHAYMSNVTFHYWFVSGNSQNIPTSGAASGWMITTSFNPGGHWRDQPGHDQYTAFHITNGYLDSSNIRSYNLDDLLVNLMADRKSVV